MVSSSHTIKLCTIRRLIFEYDQLIICCRRVNLGYADYRAIDPQAWAGREAEGLLLVPHAGEMLYRGEALFRVKQPG